MSATPVLYCFLTDDALYNQNKVDSNGSWDQGYGQLYGEAKNYFVNLGVINDIRKTRLAILDSLTAFGDMKLLFDKNRFDNELLNALTDNDIILLFNIVERIYLHQEYTDANIEYQLTNSSSYRAYVPNSLTHPTEEGRCTVYNKDRVGRQISLFDWYGFDFESETGKFKVHFILSKRYFTESYPYVTITRVLPPYDIQVLVNPISLIQSTNMQILTNSSAYILNAINEETSQRDQTGVYTYTTKYNLDSTKVLKLPFGLSYCGSRVPDTLECRNAIRTYLEEQSSLPQDAIKNLFPELYIGSRFFIVPLWSEYKEYPDRLVYRSIIPMQKIKELSAAIFYDHKDEYLEQHLEILLNPQNKMFSISLPDDLNEKHFSILEQYPSYQDYSSQMPGWKFMEASAQEFSSKLARCMAILNGEDASSEFVQIESGGLNYLSFTSGESEFLVMYQESYNKLLNIEE